MKKLILVSFLIISFQSDAQIHQGGAFLFKPVQSEIHIIPGKNFSNVYYSFRVTYNPLVFEKQGDSYIANLNILLEVFDKQNKFVTRANLNRQVVSIDFQKTVSLYDYTQGLISMELKPGEYKIIPIFTDLNAHNEIKLDTINLVIGKNGKKKTEELFVLNEEKTFCENKELFTLGNFGSAIPFGTKKYKIMLPVKDSSANTIYYKVLLNKKVVLSGKSDKNFISSFVLKSCGSDNIVLEPVDYGTVQNYFIIDDISDKLLEKNYTLEFSTDKNFIDSRQAKLMVVWFNKPFSLLNPEFAILQLKHIETKENIEKLYSFDDDKYYDSLFSFWKKYDPIPSTAFNELMNEYYERVDYSMKHFTPISGLNGADSDRGDIYIKFGKPQKVERSSDEFGRVVETWYYNSGNSKKFVFIDKTGTGNFSMLNRE